MKICYICSELPPDKHGGIGSFTKDIASELVKLGHEIWVIGFSNRESIQLEDGVNVVRIKTPAIKNCYLFFAVKRILLSAIVRKYSKREKFDLVETAEYEGDIPFYGWPFQNSIPLIVRYHLSQTVIAAMKGTKVSSLIKWAEKKVIAQGKYKIAVSKHIADYSAKCFGESQAPDAVIYNFVDIDVFYPKDVVRDYNKILFVGKMSHNKGIDLLFKIIPELLENNHELSVDIIGGDTSEAPGGTSLIEYLLKQLPAGLVDRVNYLGRVDRELLPEIYSSAGTCLFPSRVEAHSIAWLEAMACGCACVCSSIAGGNEFDSAISCDPEDTETFFTNVQELVSDVEKQKAIGSSCRNEVVNRFSRGKQIKENLDFYSMVIKQTN